MEVFLLLLIALSFAACDINIHTPRGSNNRLDETNRNRANAQRMFDSENNNAGGHNVGEFPARMYYYSGTMMKIEWANQHSCGDENNNCEVTLQYMCGENVRDGETTATIPVIPTDCVNNDCDTDARFGHHESWRYYAECYGRERNKGLFVADQELEADRATHTRQANNGARYGYECPEERDYYPYWRSSPWIDIAVFTNNVSMCEHYKQESQNVKGRWDCKFPDEFWNNLPVNEAEEGGFEPFKSMNEDECENSKYTGSDGVEYHGVWTYIEPHDVPSPECLKSHWSRDNHQGNTIGGEFLWYNWRLPTVTETQKCVIRARYNISTNDFSRNVDSTTDIKDLIWPDFDLPDLTKEDAEKRDYYFHGDPRVDMFTGRRLRFRLKLALNTAQFGRTFQDRSHVFRIKPVCKEFSGATIHNINVRGKRGNLAQTYPSAEYDFVPNNLEARVGEYVHFQWTGSDSNNPNNNGQGKAKTDRSNVVELRERGFGTPADFSFATNYPDQSEENFLGLCNLDVTKLAETYPGKSVTLDDRPSYFDSGPLKLTTPGLFYYMSTRNNQFTNRDQKGKILVLE